MIVSTSEHTDPSRLAYARDRDFGARCLGAGRGLGGRDARNDRRDGHVEGRRRPAGSQGHLRRRARRAAASSRRVGAGRSTRTAATSCSPARRSGSAWPTCSTRCWRSTPRDVEPLPHQIRPSTARCCRASRCGSCSPTTRAPARRSWPGCYIKELIAPRRRRALPDRRARRPRRAVAGRAVR